MVSTLASMLSGRVYAPGHIGQNQKAFDRRARRVRRENLRFCLWGLCSEVLLLPQIDLNR